MTATGYGGDTGGAQADPDFEPDPRRWRILAVTLVIGFMALLDVTIVNVALPSIRAGLGASSAGVQWIVSGYALTFGLTLVAGGRLGDALGRRRMMLIGLSGFLVSSAAVGLAPDELWVVVARLAQGAAAGLLTPQNSGLIQQLFRGAERGRAFGLFGLTVSVSAALGPVLGGLIIAAFGEEDGWRAIFLVNVPIGLVALVFVARLVPGRDGTGREAADRIDLVGAALLGAAVLCVLYPLVAVMAGVSPVPRRCSGCSCGGSVGWWRPAGPRCSTSACSGRPPATPPGSCSAASTSPASPACSWCSPCTCRRSSACPRWRPA